MDKDDVKFVIVFACIILGIAGTFLLFAFIFLTIGQMSESYALQSLINKATALNELKKMS